MGNWVSNLHVVPKRASDSVIEFRPRLTNASSSFVQS